MPCLKYISFKNCVHIFVERGNKRRTVIKIEKNILKKYYGVHVLRLIEKRGFMRVELMNS